MRGQAEVRDPEPLPSLEQLPLQVGRGSVEEERRVDDLRGRALEPGRDRVEQRARTVADAGVDDEDVQLDRVEARSGLRAQALQLPFDRPAREVGDTG